MQKILTVNQRWLWSIGYTSLTLRTLVQLVYLPNIIATERFSLTHLTAASLQCDDGCLSIAAEGIWPIMHYAPIVVWFTKMLYPVLSELVEIAFSSW